MISCGTRHVSRITFLFMPRLILGDRRTSIKVKAYPFNSIVHSRSPSESDVLYNLADTLLVQYGKKKQRIPNVVISRGHTARSCQPFLQYVISISIELLGPSYESFISCTTDLGPLHFINIDLKTMATVIHFCFLS
jgi:hypothetical protein